jgi:hypothetical protein
MWRGGGGAVLAGRPAAWRSADLVLRWSSRALRLASGVEDECGSGVVVEEQSSRRLASGVENEGGGGGVTEEQGSPAWRTSAEEVGQWLGSERGGACGWAVRSIRVGGLLETLPPLISSKPGLLETLPPLVSSKPGQDPLFGLLEPGYGFLQATKQA